jgi:hypothetical protein
MLMLGVHPKWITRFPNGRHVLDDGVTTDEEWWAAQDAKQEEDAVGVLLTPEQELDKRLRELGF